MPPPPVAPVGPPRLPTPSSDPPPSADGPPLGSPSEVEFLMPSLSPEPPAFPPTPVRSPTPPSQKRPAATPPDDPRPRKLLDPPSRRSSRLALPTTAPSSSRPDPDTTPTTGSSSSRDPRLLHRPRRLDVESSRVSSTSTPSPTAPRPSIPALPFASNRTQALYLAIKHRRRDPPIYPAAAPPGFDPSARIPLPTVDAAFQHDIEVLLASKPEQLFLDWLLRFFLGNGARPTRVEDINFNMLVHGASFSAMPLDPTPASGLDSGLLWARRKGVVFIQLGSETYEGPAPFPKDALVELAPRWTPVGIHFRPLINLFQDVVLMRRLKPYLDPLDLPTLSGLLNDTVRFSTSIADFLADAIDAGVLVEPASLVWVLAPEFWEERTQTSRIRKPLLPKLATPPSLPRFDSLADEYRYPAVPISESASVEPAAPSAGLAHFAPLVQALRALYHYEKKPRFEVLRLTMELNQRGIIHDGKVLAADKTFDSVAAYLIAASKAKVTHIFDKDDALVRNANVSSWRQREYLVQLASRWKAGPLPD